MASVVSLPATRSAIPVISAVGHRRARTWSAAALVVLALSIGACKKTDGTATDTGAAATSPTASTTRDACSLLTAEDARTALGVEAQRTDPANVAGTPMCQYMASNSESVTLQIQPGAPTDFDNYVKQSVEAFGATAQPVSGIGERAAQVGDQFLFSRNNQMYIIVVGKDLPPPEKAARAQQIARAVLSRI